MKKKVMLITPPYHSGMVESAGRWLNLGFLYIAGSLRDAGYDVDVYDAMSLFHTIGEIAGRIESGRPDFVGVAAITASYPDACAVVKIAKEINPQCVTIMGNVHPTFLWKEALNENRGYLDFVVRGEGEETLPELCACLNAGGDLTKVRGIAFLLNGHPWATPKRMLIQNLDGLKPAWDLVQWRDYFYRPKQDSTLAIVSSSRGCNQQCSFCSQQLFWEKSWRGRSPESFVDELAMLNREYGVNVAMLADETPTLLRDRWEKILDLLIARKTGVELLMETRVSDIIRDEDILDKYRAAGIVHIYMGVEATDQQTLDLFRKNLKVEESKRAIDLVNGQDIVSETSFVLGLPQDTPESIARTLELARYYDPDMAFFLAIAPWPYAEIYDALKDHIEETDFRRYNFVEAVVKPVAMSRVELERELLETTKKFYMGKMAGFSALSPYKQGFMRSVMDLLMNHSYLAPHIKAGAAEMPEEVRRLLNISPLP
ncbi:MAG: B12-binding domain-containing radical SAM protein [Syntrophales bacterium]